MPRPRLDEATSHTAVGCYGLQIVGIPAARRHFSPLEDSAPSLYVRQEIAVPAPRPPELLDDDHALLHLSDGTGVVELDRAAAGALLRVERAYDDEALLHPMLSSACAIANRWHGRDTFHAGAFAFGDVAWAVIGDRGQGKSSTLGYLATHDLQIVTDDLVVEEAGCVFAGPSFVDLRPDAAKAMGVGRDVGVLGARHRVRFELDGIGRARLPLAGWILLGWGDAVALEPVSLSRRLALLYDNRVVRRAPVDPATYVRHAKLPFYELTRPRHWSSLPAVLEVLRATLG